MKIREHLSLISVLFFSVPPFFLIGKNEQRKVFIGIVKITVHQLVVCTLFFKMLLTVQFLIIIFALEGSYVKYIFFILFAHLYSVRLSTCIRNVCFNFCCKQPIKKSFV